MRLLTAAALMCMSGAVMFGQQPGGPTPLKVGDQAPNFTLTSTSGAKVTLADIRGKNPLELAFFPPANTGV
jgi:peroxiredoxin